MKPRVHGNGFIQLDLDENKRLHIWGDPRIPRQQISTPIHTHIFDFTSNILKGRLIHIEYNIKLHPKGAFKMYKAVPKSYEDTDLMDNTGHYCNIVPYDTKVILAGGSYKFTANRFHENYAPEPTVTIIEKQGLTLAQNPEGPRPIVLVPVGQEPDNAFSRHDYEQAFLWYIIEDNTKDLDLNLYGI